MPAPAELRYALQWGAHTGQARLEWQHDAAHYRLTLRADVRGAPLWQQSSSGGFDVAGLAPERFVDSRRGRGALAANFQRASGRITFSGPRVEYPAWPGAQDRLSWIVQLAAIANAAGQVPPQVALFVVDGRGVGDVWSFVNQGAVVVDTPHGPVLATHVMRQPQRPMDWRVDAWLDAQRGHWPVRLRMTVPRAGMVFELQLSTEATPP